jgi:hypothetical protein
MCQRSCVAGHQGNQTPQGSGLARQQDCQGCQRRNRTHRRSSRQCQWGRRMSQQGSQSIPGARAEVLQQAATQYLLGREPGALRQCMRPRLNCQRGCRTHRLNCQQCQRRNRTCRRSSRQCQRGCRRCRRVCQICQWGSQSVPRARAEVWQQVAAVRYLQYLDGSWWNFGSE